MEETVFQTERREADMTLQDICEFIVDCPHSTAPDEGEGYPLIRTPNIGRGRLELEGVQRVSKEVYDKRNKRAIPRADDIIFAREAPAGNAAIIKGDQEVCLGQRTVLIRPDKNQVDPQYLVYYLLAPEQQYLLLGTANGATVAHVNIPTIKELPVNLPDMGQQIKIADILSAYDDLIENNQRQIKLLEEAAQRLYKEWFVDLRFPGYEKVAVVDGVPEGWARNNVGSLIGTIAKTKQIMTSEYLQEGAIPVIDQSREFIAGYTNDVTAVVDFGKPVIVFGDHTRVLKYIQFPFAKGADGTQLLVSAEENMPQTLLYCSLINVDLSNYHYARHFKYLKAEEILVPTKDIAKRFDSIANKLFMRIQCLRNSSIQSKKARDRLLPKLMSGELEV